MPTDEDELESRLPDVLAFMDRMAARDLAEFPVWMRCKGDCPSQHVFCPAA